MRILIITKHLHLGGIPRYVVNLARGLKKGGHEVWIASSGGILTSEISRYGIQHIFIPINTKSILSPQVLKTILILKTHFQNLKIDIIHSHTRVTSAVGNILAKLLKAVHITTVHGIYKKKFLRRFFPLLPRKIIAVSSETRNRLQKWEGISEHRVKVIPNAIDVEYFLNYTASKEKVREELHLDKDAFIVGNISRIEKIKGQDMLISALRELKPAIPSIKLLFVGEGKDKHRLRNRVKEMNLTPEVKFFEGQEDVRPFFRAIDVFCFTPYEEPFGLVILEAMAMKVPIVATRVGELPIITQNGSCAFLISPGDIKGLKNAILELYHNRKIREKLVVKGLNRVKEFYSLDRMIAEVLEIYSQELKIG